MKSCALRILLQLGCAYVASGCTQSTLVGEDRCYGANTVCTSPDASTPAVVLDYGQEFEVSAARTIAPRWLRALPCAKKPCFGQLAPGPDSGAWAYVSGGPDDRRLLAVSEDGQIAHDYDAELLGTLSVDRELRPQLTFWDPDGEVRILRFAEDGERSEQILSLPDTYGRELAYTVADAAGEGGVRIGRFSARESYVAQYDARGALTWRQTELRAARRFPFEDLGPGVVPFASYRFVPLADGSLAVGLPKYLGEEPDERAFFQRMHGISVLDPEGNLRWDVAVGHADVSSVNGPLLAADPNGGLVIALGGEYGLGVVAMGETGAALGSWHGWRVDYFSLRPKALCVDPAGWIYVAVLTGKRDAGEVTLCRMSSADPDESAECARLELPPAFMAGTERADGLASGDLSMVCPARGTVVLMTMLRDGAGPQLAGVAF